MNRTSEEALALRIYLGESDRLGHEPLYEALVVKARQLGLAGATVLRGPMGYGARQHLHTEKILRLSSDLPLVVEIVDQAKRVRAALPELEALAPQCLITLIRVEMRRGQSHA